ncbi:MAG: hypothetical protein Q4C67_09370, partial [Deinococcus sp.]|nr:hypothetical protein [Deinococcus sp.]
MSKLKLKDIDLDFKKDAALNRRTMAQHLQDKADAGELDESIYSPDIKDASGQTASAWKQLVVRGAGIEPAGRHQAATVKDAFFTNAEDRILFPLFIEETYREINNERRYSLRLSDVVADTITATSGSVDIGMVDEQYENEDGDLARVAEGAEF